MTTLLEKKPEGADEIRPDFYHGIPVLRLHVDDPIPTPRAPTRYAILVGPALARYLLTFNHPHNRSHKPSAIARYARDMEQGYWAFTPEPLVFSSHGVLEDGQNRLLSVEQSGVSVWLMFDFGWPEDLIERINRGSARTVSDAFVVNATSYPTAIAAAIGLVVAYRAVAGTPVRWTRRPLTAAESLDLHREAPDQWATAGGWGTRVYGSTQGLGPTTWTAAFYLIASERGEQTATDFFQELIDETGVAGSPTRKLKSLYLRRRLLDTASGDRREPLENIIRAFNAWSADKPVGFVRTGGAFVMSQIRKS